MALPMKKIWIHKARSFKEAAAFDRRYYAALSGNERLAIVQFLRESFYKLEQGKRREKKRARFRRSIKIIQ